MATKLTDREIDVAIGSLPDWERVGDEMRAEFSFADFREAFGFMSEMSMWAEKLNHHPSWSNTYNRVEVALTTHDVDGISELDLQLAEAMSDAFKKRS